MVWTGLRVVGILRLLGRARHALRGFMVENKHVLRTETAARANDTILRSPLFWRPAVCTVAGRAARQGKREASVDWQPALAAMRLTPEQLAAVLEARSSVTVKTQECAARCPQRKSQPDSKLQTDGTSPSVAAHFRPFTEFGRQLRVPGEWHAG